MEIRMDRNGNDGRSRSGNSSVRKETENPENIKTLQSVKVPGLPENVISEILRVFSDNPCKLIVKLLCICHFPVKCTAVDEENGNFTEGGSG